jgi:hypothetical protein
MRSVVVVFPASMWAMMPIFLQRSNGTVLGTTILYSFQGSDFCLNLAIERLRDLAIENPNPKLLAIAQ